MAAAWKRDEFRVGHLALHGPRDGERDDAVVGAPDQEDRHLHALEFVVEEVTAGEGVAHGAADDPAFALTVAEEVAEDELREEMGAVAL